MESERIKESALFISLTLPNHNWGFVAQMNEYRLYMGGIIYSRPVIGMKKFTEVTKTSEV
jgi:hypothetical protein